jgi:hypothetical protein
MFGVHLVRIKSSYLKTKVVIFKIPIGTSLCTMTI